MIVKVLSPNFIPTGMMNLKLTRLIIGVIFISFTTLFFVKSGSAQSVSAIESEKPTECIRFYEFAIEKYVKLIQTVYEGNEPFFVLVDYLHCNEPGSDIKINMTYTQLYRNITPLIGKYFYRYSSGSNIFIILNIEDWDQKGFAVDYFPHTSTITEKVLTQDLFQLTEEYELEHSTEKPENVTFIDFYYEKNDKYSVTKTANGIYATVNDKGIVYFNNYPKK